ncbi:MAG: 50S ribosomal protein L3 [Candidatus Magasanikbacteria bacterium]|nr:50S ribosomal protein L3 [Candidatus Magasanikbacteria bacterium]
MKFILGRKLGMTQVFLDNGVVVPVTRVLAGPCQVVQVKNDKKENATALQLGIGAKRAFRLSKPAAGHLEGLEPVSFLKDFGLDSVDGIERGDVITVDTFATGDKVAVIGTSKGKGFAGVVKRHHFRGGPASHGHKDNLRMPGSIGAGGIQRVFKDMRMAGRMGGERVTVKNLEIVEVRPGTNELYIKGAVPGGRNSILMISGEGDLKVQKKKVETPVEVAPAAEPSPAVS